MYTSLQPLILVLTMAANNPSGGEHVGNQVRYRFAPAAPMWICTVASSITLRAAFEKHGDKPGFKAEVRCQRDKKVRFRVE